MIPESNSIKLLLIRHYSTWHGDSRYLLRVGYVSTRKASSIIPSNCNKHYLHTSFHDPIHRPIHNLSACPTSIGLCLLTSGGLYVIANFSCPDPAQSPNFSGMLQ
ncbi:hypothetical protein CPB83DRAFT_859209 [Crepidotus variabilis]|uniref:Uncharacterized protein n=1 Tax=Crepidotus variabilis TaxID=179855 RepID=A0A9P6JLW0_9AGAR|nr:hypothetical protein CPB83DRAFT_859209 [Crepidotus variabilis]